MALDDINKAIELSNGRGKIASQVYDYITCNIIKIMLTFIFGFFNIGEQKAKYHVSIV